MGKTIKKFFVITILLSLISILVSIGCGEEDVKNSVIEEMPTRNLVSETPDPDVQKDEIDSSSLGEQPQPSEPTNVVDVPIKREHIRTGAPTQKPKRKSISPIVSETKKPEESNSETKKPEESQLETPEEKLVDSDSSIPKHDGEKEESDEIVKKRLDDNRSKFDEHTIKSQKHEDISHHAQEQIRRLRDKIGKDKTKLQEEKQKESSSKDGKNGIIQNSDKALEDLKKKTTNKINEEKTDE